jgi:hypothetical protein
MFLRLVLRIIDEGVVSLAEERNVGGRGRTAALEINLQSHFVWRTVSAGDIGADWL